MGKQLLCSSAILHRFLMMSFHPLNFCHNIQLYITQLNGIDNIEIYIDIMLKCLYIKKHIKGVFSN